MKLVEKENLSTLYIQTAYRDMVVGGECFVYASEHGYDVQELLKCFLTTEWGVWLLLQGAANEWSNPAFLFEGMKRYAGFNAKGGKQYKKSTLMVTGEIIKYWATMYEDVKPQELVQYDLLNTLDKYVDAYEFGNIGYPFIIQCITGIDKWEDHDIYACT